MSLTNQDDIRQLGAVLFIGAHPDDETFTAGGLLAAAAQNGQKTGVVVATKGEGGVQDEARWPAKDLGQIRAQELEQALETLGVNRLFWLDYEDGKCKDADKAKAINKLNSITSDFQPDTILTFGPDGLTGHADHTAVSAWATAVGKEANVPVYYAVEHKESYEQYLNDLKQFNFYFNTKQPPLKTPDECDIAFSLTGDILKAKTKALQTMPSQYEAIFKKSPNFVDLTRNYELFIRAK